MGSKLIIPWIEIFIFEFIKISWMNNTLIILRGIINNWRDCFILALIELNSIELIKPLIIRRNTIISPKEERKLDPA